MQARIANEIDRDHFDAYHPPRDADAVPPPSRPRSMRELQAAHAEWAVRNFGPGAREARVGGLASLLANIASTGKLAHHHLKREQGIRGLAKDHETGAKIATGDLVDGLAHYTAARKDLSDPEALGTPGLMQALGIAEEVGELAAALVEREYSARKGAPAEHMAALEARVEDAVGDIGIYLMDFCRTNGLILGDVIEETLDGVLRRDWAKNRADGVTA